MGTKNYTMTRFSEYEKSKLAEISRILIILITFGEGYNL
jgi:hypothetical protein